MTSLLPKVLTYAAFPAVAIVVGSLIAAIREPGAGLRSGVQHFAAGTVFSVLAVELLPDLMHRRMPWPTLIGFSLGVALMLTLKWIGDRAEKAEGERSTRGLVTAMGVDVGLDGTLIGLSFAAGAKQGLLLTVGLVLELLFLGVSCATSLRSAGRARSVIIRTTAMLVVALLVGAAAGAILLSSVTPVYVDAMLAFGVAALLYLVTEELLVEAHEEIETPVQTAMFFLGFILLFIIDMLI
ncbi:ZIP family metal transporter [Massilia norwichensis]|jgi:ZIP family zinc transporter|uniref:Transporter n=1 Tax=Massilia norwichensis TaxID=1442366 RepID=A0ABT2A289_9BURK|nr:MULTISPECIES: transporter [Massilia]MCS0588306.1 transporter [Massilia norwichensis]